MMFQKRSVRQVKRLPVHLFLLSWLMLLATLASAVRAEEFDPISIFLTWQQDPTTTMTIDWHTTPEDGERPSQVQYAPRDSQEWQTVQGKNHPFPYSDRTVHRAEITGLKPGSSYNFRFGADSKKYWFRTMPATNAKPIRFVTGGDTATGERFQEMNRVAMSHDPDFILWGGDLSYANDNPASVDRWHRWFEDIKKTLISDDGRVVPIIAAIGNHETTSSKTPINLIEEALKENDEKELVRLLGVRETKSLDQLKEDAEKRIKELEGEGKQAVYYYGLIAFPGLPGAYGVLDFGNYLSLVVLNSNHGPNGAVTGAQKEWLEKTLTERAGKFTNIIPVYHVPAYPGYRKYEGGAHRSIRENWVPLFEKHGVRVAFENHDHVYKRTVPILDGKEDPSGIVYIGDGAWGTLRKSTHNVDDTWYLTRAEAVRYALVVTLEGDTQSYQMVGDNGEQFDQYADSVSRAASRTQ